ncbi:MAG: hypothetical protein JW716_04005 [Candidatus Aenigmarchaeota archaeon]|nr:hypothetical protein [Candidatus Aenigmarchaeota archaeon]
MIKKISRSIAREYGAYKDAIRYLTTPQIDDYQGKKPFDFRLIAETYGLDEVGRDISLKYAYLKSKLSDEKTLNKLSAIAEIDKTGIVKGIFKFLSGKKQIENDRRTEDKIDEILKRLDPSKLKGENEIYKFAKTIGNDLAIKGYRINSDYGRIIAINIKGTNEDAFDTYVKTYKDSRRDMRHSLKNKYTWMTPESSRVNSFSIYIVFTVHKDVIELFFLEVSESL